MRWKAGGEDSNLLWGRTQLLLLLLDCLSSIIQSLFFSFWNLPNTNVSPPFQRRAGRRPA